MKLMPDKIRGRAKRFGVVYSRPLSSERTPSTYKEKFLLGFNLKAGPNEDIVVSDPIVSDPDQKDIN
jgi:hypothetical protein